MALTGKIASPAPVRGKAEIPGLIPGEKGENGESAYEIAKRNGFEGTEQEWLDSLKGEGGGDGVFTVNFTSSPTYASDKTTAEIIAAYLEGKTLYANFNTSGGDARASSLFYVIVDDSENLKGYVSVLFVQKNYITEFCVNNLNGVERVDASAWREPFLPNTGTTYNGKVLSVVNGVRAWVDPSELEGVGTTEVVHVSVSHTADGDVYTSDKTVAEILALHDSGKLIAIDLLDSGYHWYFSDGWVAVTSKDPYRGVLQFANHVMYFTAENWQTETDVFNSSLKEDIKITEVSSPEDITDTSPDGIYTVPQKAVASVHTSIDLSKLDAEGIIDEVVVTTFDDNTQESVTKRTTMEFDADGNPIKITDADGNETVLTW